MLKRFDSATDYTSRPRLGDLPAELSAQLYGYTYSMAILWLIASMLFIFSFQWHRWRASR